MGWLWGLFGVLLLATVLIGILAVCFYMAFYVPKKEREQTEDYPIPDGEIYEPFRDRMIRWMKELETIPCEDMSVTSFDGLTLKGKFYPYSKDAPIELMFPGYRGNAKRDLCGGVQRCFAIGHSALIVDQRAGGESEGNVISFGVNESRDCQTWIRFMIDRFGVDVKIVLCGISMGAATVLMAAGTPLEPQVIGVLADCGYTGAEDIIKKVIADMKLPPKIAYPFVRLSGKLFGGFDIAQASPVTAVQNSTVPIIFFHGEDDAYVPCDMSRINFEHCASEKKRLVTIPKAGHGLCYPVDREAYITALKEFWNDCACTK